MGALEELNLSWNEIGDAGMIAFADAIKPTAENPIGSLPNLRLLDLGDNTIGDEGMKAFALAIASGSLPALEDLEGVDLGNNPGDSAPVDEALANREI
jgi:hypothetical protein